ncbi:MAG TPA: hypothetical protein VK155_00820, partial [Bacteroidales bacterium]|nr:hypothetical protein [Bacteroidales bacterium]
VEAARCSVAVQTWSDLKICHGIKVFKRTDAGIRVQEQVDFYSVQYLFAKTVTSLLMLPSVLCVRAYFNLLSALIFLLVSFYEIANPFLFLLR